MSERRTYAPGAHRGQQRQTGPRGGGERRQGPATGPGGAERRGAPGESLVPPEEHGEDYISERELLDKEP